VHMEPLGLTDLRSPRSVRTSHGYLLVYGLRNVDGLEQIPEKG